PFPSADAQRHRRAHSCRPGALRYRLGAWRFLPGSSADRAWARRDRNLRLHPRHDPRHVGRAPSWRRQRVTPYRLKTGKKRKITTMYRLADYLPILDWGRRYSRATLTNDIVAAIIVTIMLIPQSLAYAMLAGLPAEIGLYASILPLVAYAAFGTSRSLAVGPVAVVSLMTASAIGEIAVQGTPAYLAAALLLAFLSGAMLITMGLFKLGFVANFLSHPVISGFITASGLLIAAGQLKYLLGIPAGGHTLPQIATGLLENIGSINLPTLAIGTSVLAFLYFVRLRLKRVLVALGLSARMADITTKAGPVAAVAATILAVTMLDLGPKGVALVGAIPQGLPVLA